jgi:hypothetical protein
MAFHKILALIVYVRACLNWKIDRMLQYKKDSNPTPWFSVMISCNVIVASKNIRGKLACFKTFAAKQRQKVGFSAEI